MARSWHPAGTPRYVAQAFGIPVVLAMTMFSAAVAAQQPALRDPTEPPAAFRAKPASAKGSGDVFRPEHLVMVDGKRFVVWKGRRYGVGDTVQGGRIERLDESGVWLHRDGEMRKLPLFGAVEKSQPHAGAPTSSVSPGTAKGRS
jgi:hypothetical protein